jgi:hypothetical protein
MKKLLLVLVLFFSLCYGSKGQLVDTLYCYTGPGGAYYTINGNVGETGTSCTYNGNPNCGPSVMVAIIDSCTCGPWSNLNANHGHLNLHFDFPFPYYTVCRGRPEYYFLYPMNNPSGFTGLHNWIRDSLADGHFVLIFSGTTWSWTSNNNPDLDSVMTELGSTQWPPQDSVPFAFFVKKGDASTVVEDYGTNPNDSAIINTIFTCDCAIGVEEIDKAGDEMIISPNPTQDYFLINRRGELKIYDAPGRLVKEQTIIDSQSRIDCHDFSKGIYFVKVNDEEKTFTQKLVIE